MIAAKALEEFGQRKLSLMAIADKLGHLAEAMEADRAAKRVALAMNLLLEERFNLAVLGGFKRGKSTFVNALLGSDLLPVGVVPLTSIVTKVVFGEQRNALIIYLDGRTEYAAIENLGQYVTEKGNPGNQLRIAEVRVSFDSKLLKNGISIVDTPGTGSTFTENTRITREFMEHADAGVFVFSADPPIGESEFEFLRLIKTSFDRIFFVQNKIDRMTEEEWTETMEFSASLIETVLAQQNVKVYPLSAKNALEAKLRKDPLLLRASRFNEFERDLEYFLAEGKGDAILDNARTKLLQVAGDLEANAALELAAISRPTEELESKLQWLKEQDKKAITRLKEAAYLIDGSGAEVANSVDNDLNKFIESGRGAIAKNLRDKLEGIGHSLGRSEYLVAVADIMMATVSEALVPFIAKEQALVSEAFQNMAERFQTEANDIIASVREHAAAAFGINPAHNMKRLSLNPKKEYWLDVKSVISFDLLFVGEIESALPKKMLHRLVESKAVKMIPEELEVNAGRYRYDLKTRLSESCWKLKQEYQISLKEAINAIEGAMNSGIAIKKKTAETASRRASFLIETDSRLDDIIADLIKSGTNSTTT